jgi:hypothetical protein
VVKGANGPRESASVIARASRMHRFTITPDASQVYRWQLTNAAESTGMSQQLAGTIARVMNDLDGRVSVAPMMDWSD